MQQRIFWTIFMAYCVLADINQRLFICERHRWRSIAYKPLYWCAFGIKLTDVKTMRTLTNTSLFIIGSDSQVQQILTIYLCDQCWSQHFLNQITRKWKSIDLYVRQIPGSEKHFFSYCFTLPDLYGSAWNKFIALLTKREVKMAGYYVFSFHRKIPWPG